MEALAAQLSVFMAKCFVHDISGDDGKPSVSNYIDKVDSVDSLHHSTRRD